MHFCSVFYDLWYRYSCFERTWWEAWITTRKESGCEMWITQDKFTECRQQYTWVKWLHLVIVHCILTISKTKFWVNLLVLTIYSNVCENICNVKIVIWKMRYVNVVLFSCFLVEMKLFSELVYACWQLRDNPSYLRIYNIYKVYTIPEIGGIVLLESPLGMQIAL